MSGGMEFEELIDRVHKTIEKTTTLFAVHSLKIYEGGRAHRRGSRIFRRAHSH